MSVLVLWEDWGLDKKLRAVVSEPSDGGVTPPMRMKPRMNGPPVFILQLV
jgi:hypothetical protein